MPQSNATLPTSAAKESRPPVSVGRACLIAALYYAAFCCAFAIANMTLWVVRPDYPAWYLLITQPYLASHVAIVVGWFTLLPAFLIARWGRSHVQRATWLFVGILACLLPLWLGLYGPLGQRPAWHTFAAMSFAAGACGAIGMIRFEKRKAR